MNGVFDALDQAGAWVDIVIAGALVAIGIADRLLDGVLR